jgi:hypothetical protein
VLLLPVILLFAAPALIFYLLYTGTLYLLIWTAWLPYGKDVLFVYSDSPIWHDYMTGNLLPLVRERAVVLNWSERKQWSAWSLAVLALRHFGGGREFNPLVVLFPPVRRAKVFRFWSPFQEWKTGDKERVEKPRQDLLNILVRLG